MRACGSLARGGRHSPPRRRPTALRSRRRCSNSWNGLRRVRTMRPISSAPTRATALLLNFAHALDHMFLLIFATAVGAIAADFGFADWESLMPYGVGAFFLFGIGSLPAGRLGDLWGRRRMMLIFFFGMAASSLLAALTRDAWQLAGALTLLGAFSSIYHPVGIPMLVRGTERPGLT